MRHVVVGCLVATTCAGLVVQPSAPTRPRVASRHAAPRCQFKLPDFFQSPEENDGTPPPPPPPAKNPFASFVDAFTPVEVDRDGNVVGKVDRNGNVIAPQEATTDAEDRRAKERIAKQAAVSGDEPDLGEKLFSMFVSRRASR